MRELARAQVVRPAVEAEAHAGEGLVPARARERVEQHARARRSGRLGKALRGRCARRRRDLHARDRLDDRSSADPRLRLEPRRNAQDGAELANVPRPGVAAQAGGRLRREYGRPRELGEEGGREEPQVVRPLAQRRHVQDAVLEQAVVEIGPQEAALDECPRLLVRGGDDRCLAPQRARPAEAPQLSALHEAEHLCLVREGHRGDLVEEEDPAAGALDGSRAVEGAREGAARRPEELALEVVGGHRRAVEHLDVSGAGRQGGQRRRHEFLPASGLADHERAAPGRRGQPRDLGAQPPDRRRLAEDRGESAPRRDRREDGSGEGGRGRHASPRGKKRATPSDHGESRARPARRPLVAAPQPAAASRERRSASLSRSGAVSSIGRAAGF